MILIKKVILLVFIDLTHELRDNIPVFDGDPKFRLKSVSKDDDYSLYEIKSGLHSGTHIDAPYHFIKNGKKVHELNLNNLIGQSNILTLKNNETKNKEIAIDDLEIPEKIEDIVILNTTWFKKWGNDNYFRDNFYLSKETTKLFLENEIKGIAIDCPSVDKYSKSTMHKLLLKNDVWIVENLTNLNNLDKNKYTGFFIPMKIDSEASFIRAFLKG